METYDYQTAKRITQGWVPDCANEIKKQLGGEEVPTHEGSLIDTKDDVVATLEVGGALVQMAVFDKGHKQYQPILIVTEKVFRQHRIGIGHQHVYFAMQSGRPNFKKSVKNAVNRAKEIQLVAKDEHQFRAKAQDLDRLMKDELKGVRVPAEFLVARCQDGSYTLHVGTMKLTLEALTGICNLAHGQKPPTVLKKKA